MPDLTTRPVAVLVTGIPGAGKTTVARSLARRFTRAAHIEVDVLQAMIVAGGLWPDQSPREEAMRQLELRARHGALLAASFVDAGIAAVLDDVIVGPDRLALYRDGLGDRLLHLVVLAPPLEVVRERDRDRGYKQVGERWAYLDAEQREKLGGLGLWIDSAGQSSEETADAIVRGLS